MKLQNITKIEDKIEDIFDKKDKPLYPDFPKKNLLIEISNYCNSSCIFCANRKMTRKKKEINPMFLKRILKEAYELGAREVGFYTTGEPLLNKNLEYYISLAKKIGYQYIYITTNGILANIDRMKKLINAGLNSIKFSINAINENEYKFVHGISAYNIVMNNLTDLYNYKKESLIEFNVYVSYVATRYTEYDNDVIVSNFSDKCDKVIIVNARNQSGMMPEINSLLAPINQDCKIQANRVLPCHYTFDCAIITVEGYLNACCTDFQNYLAYADLNKTSLKKAWTNDVITELRRKQKNNDLKGTLCDNCINNSTDIPKPLSSDLYSPMKSIVFTDFSLIKERIKNFKNN